MSLRFIYRAGPCLALAVALVAPRADAQPRRAPVRAVPAPRRPPAPRRAPPPPPPPPAQFEDPESATQRPRPTGPDPFSDPAPPPDAPVETAPPGEPEETSDDARAHPVVDVELQYRLFSRTLTWDDDTSRSFRPYDLSAASAARVVGEVYPLRLVTDGALSHLGVTASFGRAFALASSDSAGRQFDTTTYDLSVGLRYRLPLRASLPDLGVAVAWTRQVFYVRASETLALAGVPDLVYDGVRAALSARIPVVWRLSLRVEGGFTVVYATGELNDAFLPHASTLALDGNVTLALRVWRGLEARLGFDARSYSVSANREPGDRYAVTGATDTWLAGTAGLAWRN